MADGSMATNSNDLENVLEDLDSVAEESSEKMSLGDAIDAFAHRSFGALLTLIGLVAALPIIGGIPGMSILTGTLVILIAVQFLIGRDSPWVPQRLRKLKIGADSMQKGVEAAKPYAAKVDSLIKPRLTVLTDNAAARTVIALASVALALAFYPMALVPWGVMIPALSVMALGLALMGRDGALAIVGYAGAAATAASFFWLL